MLYPFIHLFNRYLLCPFYVQDKELGTIGNTGSIEYPALAPAPNNFTAEGRGKKAKKLKDILQLRHSDANKMLEGAPP